MLSVADVVELRGGSVGVISEPVAGPDQAYRVEFPEGTYHVALASEIASTLDAGTYVVGMPVDVWPHSGEIVANDGSSVTVMLDRSERVEGVGILRWQPHVDVPLWRIVLDNDPRLQRIWK